MMRMVLLVCAMQLMCPGFSQAETRDQIVVLALLGQLPGDKADTEDGSKVVDVQRIDNLTIAVEIKTSNKQRTIKIREEPACVFSIGSKYNYFAKVYFGGESNIFPNETNVWLEGKNAYCSYIQRECFDYVPLSFLGVPDKLNENQLEAAKSLRRNYCNAGIHGGP